MAIGIIALLIGIFMPTLNGARRQAKTVECASKLHQLEVAIMNYVSCNKGKFPTNTLTNFRMWYHPAVLGRYLPTDGGMALEIGGKALQCPEDDDSQRSYTMNVWASSKVDLTKAQMATGKFFQPGDGEASRLILVADCWDTAAHPHAGSGSGFYGELYIGFVGATPGIKFGVNGGLTTLINIPRYGYVNCELPYMRHRKPSGPGHGTQPIGFVNIGYADGHVALKSNLDLANPATGLSTLDSLWNPLDPSKNH